MKVEENDLARNLAKNLAILGAVLLAASWFNDLGLCIRWLALYSIGVSVLSFWGKPPAAKKSSEILVIMAASLVFLALDAEDMRWATAPVGAWCLWVGVVGMRNKMGKPHSD